MINDPLVHRGRVDDVATISQLDERGISFILVPKEYLKCFRMTGLAFVRTGVPTQTNAPVSTAEDEVTGLIAGVN